MPVKIHGKEYKTVAERVHEFREDHPDWAIETEVLFHDDKRVVTKTTVSKGTGGVISTGLAEENRAASHIHKTSALEVCETSSVGRALAFIHGKYMGSEIASANEVENAIKQQNTDNETTEYLTVQQINNIKALMSDVGADPERFMKWLGDWLNIESLGYIPASAFDTIISTLESKRGTK